MLDLSEQSLWVVTAAFAGAAAAIAVVGTRLSHVADALADRTGLGEVLAGALFVGAATSLPGAITSMTTAAQDAPQIAVGNALGGLTAQTAFIAIADLFYRRANLEHAAASVAGLTQGVLLVVLLSIPLLAANQPQITIWGVHPASVLILACYAGGLKLLASIQDDPMWMPVQTDETRESISEEEEGEDAPSDRSLWTRMLVLAALIAAAGYVIGQASVALVAKTGLSESAVGTVFAAIANSLPELVTAIAAVRIGAVSLALGDVIGGNSFEVMFLSAADFFYDGSIYGAIDADNETTAVIAMLMTGVLLLGMLRREKTGIARIGFESALVLLLYVFSVVVLFI